MNYHNHIHKTSSSSCGFCRRSRSIPQRAVLLALIMAAVCSVHDISPLAGVFALSLGGPTRPTRTSLQMSPSRVQLNYKDNDDDDLVTTVIEQQKFRTRVLSAVGSFARSPGRRLKKRRSLSKALFPPDEHEDGSVDDILKGTHVVPKVQDTEVQQPDTLLDDETYLSLTKAAGRRVIGRKKKTPQLIVKNIHELREAILDRGLNLRDVDLEYSIPESSLTSNRGQSDEMVLPGEDVALDSLDEPNSDEWQLIGNLLAENAPTFEEDAIA